MGRPLSEVPFRAFAAIGRNRRIADANRLVRTEIRLTWIPPDGARNSCGSGISSETGCQKEVIGFVVTFR